MENSNQLKRFLALPKESRCCLKKISDNPDCFKLLANNLGIDGDTKDLLQWVASADDDAINANSDAPPAAAPANNYADIIASSTPPAEHPSKLKDQWPGGEDNKRKRFKKKTLVDLYDEMKDWGAKKVTRIINEYKKRLLFERKLRKLQSSLKVNCISVFVCDHVAPIFTHNIT